MNKKIRTAAAAIITAGLMTACSSNNVPVETMDSTPEDIISADDPARVSSDNNENVDVSEQEQGDVSTVSMPVVNEPEVTEAKTQGSYLSQIMFVGDDMCAGLADSSRVDKSRVFADKNAGTIASDAAGTVYSNGSAAEWASENKPPYIYIWVGINDLSYCNDYTYYMGMKSAITALNEASPDSIIAVMSLPPVAENSSWDNDVCGGGASYDLSVYQETIDTLVSDLGNSNIVTIDTSSVLRNADGRLNEQYDSGDGIHINSDGYEAICSYIEENRFFNETTGDIQSENMPVVTDTQFSGEIEDPENPVETSDPIHDESKPTQGDDGSKKKLTAARAPYNVSSPKVCYLTFDDGPSDNTNEILDILKENNIKATFFIVGWCVDGREDILKRIADEGHTIGIHTYSHDYEEIYASVDAYTNDFEKAYNVIYDTCGVKPWLFRYPGGSYNNFNKDNADKIISEMDNRGFTYFDWSCATSDATVGSTYDSCMENFKDSLNSNYETVLMHDSKEVTLEYLQDLIDYAASEGYSFETLDTADPIHF